MKKSIALIFACLFSLSMLAQKKNSNFKDTNRSNLLENKWLMVDSLTKKQVQTVEINNIQKELFLQFPAGKDNLFWGFSGCNNYKGTVSAGERGDIKFIKTTKETGSCDNGFDKKYQRMLGFANKYMIKDDLLILYNYSPGYKLELAYFKKESKKDSKKKKKEEKKKK